jgi:hypothetical protein
MARAPNEVPGRPTSTVVPIWSDNEDPAKKAESRRAAVEWRRRHPSWWQRTFRRRSLPAD